MKPTELEAALELLERGFSVIPVGADKHPRETWKPWQSARMPASSVRQRFGMPSVTGVGIVCGQISGLMVLDVDDGGMPALPHLEALIPANVPRVKTGSGGRHFYFKLEPEQGISGWHWEGVRAGELRGEGAYVVAPPSLHPNGQFYEWLVPLSDELPAIPPALLEIVRPLKRNAISLNPATSTSSNENRKIPVARLMRSALRRALENGRNNAGYVLACQLRDQGLDQNKAASIMVLYAQTVSKISDHEYVPAEALASLEQAFKHEPQNAVQVPRKRVHHQRFYLRTQAHKRRL